MIVSKPSYPREDWHLVFIDARDLPDGHRVRADICIIGAGPAGISLAREFISAGRSVCLLESGGLSAERSTQRLYRGRNTGHVYFQLEHCRNRHFGGSTNSWGGWCRPFDAIDYQRRAWVPDSGWPFGPEEMAPFIRRAEALCQLDTDEYDGDSWAERGGARPLTLDRSGFTDEVFQFSPPTRFGDVYRDDLLAAPNVTVILHANVTSIDLAAESSRVSAIRFRHLESNDRFVEARHFVLAVGGIENARLLLASNQVQQSGVGNQHDLVGRYFMEHPHVAMGYFLPSSRGYDNRFYEKRSVGSSVVKGVLVPSAEVAEREGILGIGISPEPPGYSVGDYFSGWPRPLVLTLTRLQRLTQESPMWGVIRRSEQLLLAVGARSSESRFARELQGALATLDPVPASAAPRSGPGDRYRIYCRSEQAPDRSSRVALSTDRDALGVPRVTLDWRLRDIDIKTIKVAVTRMARAVGAAGLGRMMLPSGWNDDSWSERIVGGPHHMGTTRMSDSPSQGVVDRHCRVHGLGNLHIAGSSVFPTSGYANPTLMLVALSLRLADHLKVVLA